MTTLETLKQARALIAKGWTQGAMARDKWGVRESAWSPCAASFCAIGAVRRACGPAHEIRDGTRALEERCKIPLEDFNDSHTQAEVLALFDRTIAELEGAP